MIKENLKDFFRCMHCASVFDAPVPVPDNEYVHHSVSPYYVCPKCGSENFYHISDGEEKNIVNL